jgi:hypothetical protein
MDYKYTEKENLIETGIDGLVVYKNKEPFIDERGSLFKLKPNQYNPDLDIKIADLVNVIADDKKPRGGHYHKISQDHAWCFYGTALWFFVDFRDESLKEKSTFACILGLDGIDDGIFSDLPDFSIKKIKKMTHLNIPQGIYHIVWSLGDKPLMLTEAKTEEFNESDYVRISPDEIKEVIEFKKKYNL